MESIDRYLYSLKSSGLSSPAGIHWDRFCKFVVRRQDGGSDTPFPAPLILGGAVASHAHKHQRLAEQLLWAQAHHCLPVAIAYLEALSPEKWNQSAGDDWDTEHPDVIEAELNCHLDR